MRTSRLRLRRARRTAPCRRGPSSRLRRWRGRRSSLMPIDSVSTCGWSRAQRVEQFARAAEGRAALLRCPRCGVGITIRPRRRSRGSRGDRRRPGRDLLRPAAVLAGLVVDVDLDQHVQRRRVGRRDGGRGPAPACRGPRSAPSRSASAASRALFDCRWPIRCHSSAPRSRQLRACLAARFLHVVLAEGALARRRPVPRPPSRRLGLADTPAGAALAARTPLAAFSSRCRMSCRACVSTFAILAGLEGLD